LITLVLAGKKRVFWYFSGWTAASAMGVAASGYFFPHYFQQILPPLALLAALGGEALYGAPFWRGLPPRTRGMLTGAALAILPALTFYPFEFDYSPEKSVREIYPGEFFDQMPAMGKRIAETTKPGDKVFIFGAEPELLFYARRASATRYIFLFPLYGPYRDALEKQRASAAEVMTAKPAAAVYLPNNLFFLPGTEQFFTNWTNRYLAENFYPDSFPTMDSAGVAHRLILLKKHPESGGNTERDRS